VSVWDCLLAIRLILRIDLRGYIILSHCGILPHSNINLVSDSCFIMPYCTCTRYFTITVLYDVPYVLLYFVTSIRVVRLTGAFPKATYHVNNGEFDIQCLFTIVIVVNDNYYDSSFDMSSVLLPYILPVTLLLCLLLVVALLLYYLKFRIINSIVISSNDPMLCTMLCTIQCTI